jgi:hypothetical protein
MNYSSQQQKTSANSIFHPELGRFVVFRSFNASIQIGEGDIETWAKKICRDCQESENCQGPRGAQ